MFARWLTPILFLAAAAWVSVHNGAGGPTVLTLPFMDAFVGPDPRAQGEATVLALVAVGLVSLIKAMLDLRQPTL